MPGTDYYDQADARTESIFGKAWLIEETDKVPEVTDLTYGPTGKLLETAALVVDMRGSTDLVSGHHRETVAKIHNAFLNEMVIAATREGAKVRGFAGDRVIALSDADGRECERLVTVAANMQTICNHVINPIVSSRYGESVSCGVGVARGRILATKVGTQRDPNNNDLIWVGGPVNVASKLADRAPGSGIWITSDVYLPLPHNLVLSSVTRQSLWAAEYEQIGEERILTLKSDGVHWSTVTEWNASPSSQKSLNEATERLRLFLGV